MIAIPPFIPTTVTVFDVSARISQYYYVHVLNLNCAEAGPGLTRVCQLGCNDGSEDFLNTVVTHAVCSEYT